MKPITKAFHRLTAIGTALMSAVVLCTALPKNTASSASVDYPPVLLRISTSDNSSNLSISGTADKSACGTAAMQNTQNESWRFDYTGTDSNGSYYRIVNQASGRVLTPMGYSLTDGTDCVIFGNENEKSQYWYVKAVDKDSYGNDLHYQILNYADKNLALTNGNQITLQKYSGSSTQKWLLNAVGLQGFGGYCKDMNGKEKACNLGGTLGKVVEVSTFDELKAACTNNETCTIVITKNISKTGTYQKDGNGRYRFTDAKIYVNPNKTIIGSYGAHSLYNVFFQTFGENYGPGHDLIFRNIEISHDKELNSDNIWEFAYGSNYWIDHITFVGHDKVNGASTRTDDWDKFLNFKGNTDFITISDCKFGLHEYGVLLGYPTDTQETYDQYNGHPCVTLTSNFYQNCITRAPGLMRYGYFHSLNNYVINFDMGYTIYTACKLFSESNYFDAGTGKGSVVNDTVSSNDISSKYPGVYTDIGSTLIHSSYGLNGKTAKACPWRPASNYTYKALSAEQAKNYCINYSGAQSVAANMTHSAFSAAGYRSANFIAAPDTTMEPEVIAPLNGRLISNLVVTDSTRKSWNIDDNVQIGDLIFGDRDVIWTALPAELAGGEAIVTACDAKNSTADALATFQTIADITLWIALDNRVETVPPWMQHYTKTNLTAQNNKGVTFDLYSKAVKAGETVTLGANGQSSNCVNYSVIAVLPKQDITGDGVTDLQDVIALQDYLLTMGTLHNPAAADMNHDGRINTVDLTLLKQTLLTAPSVTTTATEPDVTTTTTTTTTSVSNSYESADFRFSGKVYLVGDSTVCDYDSNTNSTLDRYGWGQKFAGCFNNVQVTNLALSGRSSRSFLTETNYQTLKSSIGKGDYLFIQFGHNDEKTDESKYPNLGTYPNLDWNTLDSSGKDSSGRYSYEYILAAYYINLAKNAGAQPVLVTPITRRSTDGKPNYSGHTDYQNGMLTLGKNYNVPVIDMTALTTELYNNLYNAGGANETAKMHCYTDAAHTTLDNTHLSGAGAQKIASMIAEQTEILGLSIGKNKK